MGITGSAPLTMMEMLGKHLIAFLLVKFLSLLFIITLLISGLTTRSFVARTDELLF
jgi:hypothetical protein